MDSNNLGIYDNNDINNNSSLINNSHIVQGTVFSDDTNESITNTSKIHNLLFDSFYLNIKSFIDSIYEDDSVHSHNEYSVDDISEKEKKFKKLLTEYSILYKLFNESLMNVEKLSPLDLEEHHLNQIKLDNLNEELIRLAQNIIDNMDFISNKDKKLNKQIHLEQKKLHEYMVKLKIEKQKLKKTQIQNIDTLNGVVENTGLVYTSRYYFYIVWVIVAITVIGLTMNVILNPEANTINSLIVMGALAVVYIVANYMNN